MGNKSLPEDFWKKLDEPQLIFLATSEKDQPRLRPVTLINLEKKLFVHSFKETAKVRQIKMNPKTEFCLFLGESAPPSKRYVRVRCNAQVVADRDVKAKIYNQIGFVKQYHQSPDDPNYILIELQPLAWQLT
jgi:uncharacterized pyridoxamine 5'-phosphate oxidase family protein